jgi:Arc/MetJ-type ribon-helix-helix transcriptional regulator
VEEAVARDFHVSKADLIREAVREKLSKMSPPEQGENLRGDKQ